MPARRAERPSLAISSDVRRAPRAPRASALATMTTKLARSSTGMVSTPTRAPQSTIARSPLATARSSTRAMPRSSIRSACSGRAGAGSTRHAVAVREPGRELRRRGDRPAGDPEERIRHGHLRGRHLGGISRRQRQIEHEGTLVGGSERHRAGRGAHAAAGADQRDVTLVTQSGRRAARVERTRCGQSLTQARSVDAAVRRCRPRHNRAPVAQRSRSLRGATRRMRASARRERSPRTRSPAAACEESAASSMSASAA